MRLFMFGNEEHSATKEIDTLNKVLGELNQDLSAENHKLSRLKDRYDWVAPMQFKYAVGTAEYNYCMNQIATAQSNYYSQYNKTQEIENKINEVKEEMSFLN